MIKKVVIASVALVVLTGVSLTAYAGFPGNDTTKACSGGTWWIDHTDIGFGQQMPEFGFKTCAGEEQSIADYKGTPVLVNFWATWCPPCIEELPNFAEFAEKSEGEVAVVGISVDLKPEDLQRFSRDNEFVYDVAWDGGGIAADLGINSIPLTIALNDKGELVGVHQGYASVEDLEELLDRAN